MSEVILAFKFAGEEYRLDRLMVPEAKALQKATGKTIAQFFDAYRERDVFCLVALVWVLRKRQEPTLKLEDIDGDLMSFKDIPLEADEESRAEGNEVLTVESPEPP